MSLFYRIAADVLVVLHAGIALFIAVGLILILLGAVRRWEWVRNFWFRAGHLVAIAIVVAESWFGVVCPLTTWEKRLRELSGGAAYRGDFIAYWVNEWLYFELPAWVFTTCYTLFGLAVLAAFVWAPPRRPSKTTAQADRQVDSSSHETGDV